MVKETRQESDSELSDADRRRRLALVYRLLIEVGQRGNSACEGAKQDRSQKVTERREKHGISASLPD